MANKTFVQNGTFTVADNDAVAFGASVAGTEIVKILSGVTGVKLDANFERLDLSGALSTYKFVVVSGTGLQIQNASDNSIVATLPNINQQVKIVFTDGAAILKQTGSTAFTLNDANIVVGVTSDATTPSFTLSTWAVDLSATAGIQSASSITVNSTEASNGKSIASAIQAPNDIDITKIKIVLAGANLDALVSKDQLVLDAAKSLNADFTGSNIAINSITGIDYAYTAATKTLTLTKNGGGALTASNVDNIVAGILFKTASTTQGIRTATISYVDAAGTESSSATTTLTVSTSTGPDAVDLSATTGTQATAAITVNTSEASAGKSIAAAIQAPSATNISSIKIVLSGAGLDTAVSKDQLVLDVTKSLNADFTGSNIAINSIAGIDYAYTLATKTLTLTKNGGGALTAADVDNIVAGILFKTASTTQGDRIATISYVDTAGNTGTSAATTLTVDTTAPTAPTAVTLTPVGGTVVANTLNTTNTNMTAAASITAGQATGGSAVLKVGSTPIATDSSILVGDTSTTFTLGTSATSTLQAAVLAGGVVTVEVTDAAGNTTASTVSNPTLAVDYTAPTAAATPLTYADTDSSGGHFTDTDVITLAFSEALSSLGTKSTTTSKAFNTAGTVTLASDGLSASFTVDAGTTLGATDVITLTGATDLAGNTETLTFTLA